MPVFPSVIKSKLPNTGITIFTTMSKLAAEHNAINLSQGFPDFNGSPKLIELVNKHMKAGDNQYAPMAGVLSLRERIAEKAQALYGTAYDPVEEITITAGGTQAIYTAISAVVREGDEVLVFTPAYDCYIPAIELCGGRAICIPTVPPDYSINWNDVKRLISQRTRLIILNSPHNPTGQVLSAKDMKALQQIVKGTDILLLSDEVYEHILFDGQKHESVLKYPGLAERSFAIFSFGKTYHMTGWKIGYCMAPANLMVEFRKAHQYQVFAVNTPLQMALSDYMKDKDAYLELGAFYQQKRDLFISLLKDSRFGLSPSKGTYFQLMCYDKITEEADTDFAVRLTREAGVASIPVSVFYMQKNDHKMLRFCFAKSDEVLKRAADKLCKI